MISTLSQRPSRQPPGTSTTPPGASSRSTVSGSRISTMPVSSSTVAVQIVFEPDIGGYSVGSMMMKPASQSARGGRHDQVGVAGDAAARLVQEQPAQAVAVARERAASARRPSSPAGGSTPPVTTFPTSPPAWHPTTVIVRRARIGASIPA